MSPRVCVVLTLLLTSCGRIGYDQLEDDPRDPLAPPLYAEGTADAGLTGTPDNAPSAGGGGGGQPGSPSADAEDGPPAGGSGGEMGQAGSGEPAGVGGMAGGGSGGVGIAPDCNTTGCPQNATCVVVQGTPECVCDPGYEGPNCVNIDECATNNGGCDPLAACVDQPGSYSCNCPELYEDENGDGSSCTPTPFGAAEGLSVSIDSEIDQDPTFSSDLLEVYFASNRQVGSDIWRATRASLSDAWSPAELVTELNSPNYDAAPELSPDGLTIWYSSGGQASKADLLVATRPSRSAPWSTPVPIGSLNTPESELAASVTSDGLLMFFARNHATGADLYYSTRSAVEQPWQTAEPLTSLNSPLNDWDPASADGLHLYFSRSGQILQSRRATLQADFPEPAPVPGLEGFASASDPWISADQRTIAFSAPGPTGERNIFIAQR